jgi:protein gp37
VSTEHLVHDTPPERVADSLRWAPSRQCPTPPGPEQKDLFHPAVSNYFIAAVFARMLVTPRHTYQVLTKRPQRMAGLLNDPKFDGEVTDRVDDWIYDHKPGIDPEPYLQADHRMAAGGPLVPNLWLGTSIESDTYCWRADHLRATPAAVRFLSLEPLLGPLPALDLTGIDWVIVGGESGPGARPMHLGWVRDIRDRCQAAGVAFFFKQWGAWAPAGSMYDTSDRTHLVLPDGTDRGIPWGGWKLDRPEAEPMRRFGKRAAGRDLDGRTWDQYPKAAAVG